MTNIETINFDRIIDNAVKVAAIGVASREKEGSTQISNLLNLLQSNKGANGIKILILYIIRQAGSRGVINEKAARLLVADLQWMITQEGAIELAIQYLTYLKWANDGMKDLGNKRSSVSSLSDLIKVVTS